MTDYYRRRGAFARATEALAGEPVVVETDSAAEEELAQCLRPLIATLPSNFGQALELTELEGKTQAEAAETLGLSLSGMKSRVTEAGRSSRKSFSNAATWRSIGEGASSVTRLVTGNGVAAPARDGADAGFAVYPSE